MASDRLALALRELQLGDWLVFERFAAEFLAVEFPSLRTMAAAAGDKGRDGQLFLADEDVKTVFQYSITENWRAKVNVTVATLAKTMPQVTRLIYCTNQVIGPAADELVEKLRAKKIALDVRDRSWFTEREHTAPQREITSEDLASRIVDPLLGREGVKTVAGPTLSDDDARVALLHLTLQGYDETSDRNLTKSCFEALVLAALHDTRADLTLSAEDVGRAVKKQVPADSVEQVNALISGALKKLSAKNGPVKHLLKEGQYHLSFQEQQRSANSTMAFVANQRSIEDELAATIGSLGLPLEDGQADILAAALRSGVEEVLFRRGEAFARAVAGGVMTQVDVDEVLGYLTEEGRSVLPLTREAAAEVIFAVLENPSPHTRAHLGRLADGYTLFAFLRQTVDVQKTVLSIFSGGEIWLDTTIILPLFAETLIEDPGARHYTVLLSSAVDAGFRLYVTDGIVEEIERHLNRALQFSRMSSDDWRSNVPFLYAAFALSGRARGHFFDWLTEFRGKVSPEDDIKEYLLDEYRIRNRNLLKESEDAPTDLRGAVQEVWYEAHERRRQRGDRADIAPEISSRLVAHDVECTVGVLQLRKGAERAPTGYMQWWLTLDRVGFTLGRELKQRMSGISPPSPALSPDFLSQLLRLGPLRTAIEGEKHVSLPIVTAITRYEAVPSSLIELADSTRKRFEGQSERVVQRQVRDTVNGLRWREGVEAAGGVRGAEDRVKARLEAQARRSS